ncbi:uncharacterized protein LOC117639357 isoform X2 [Thrips palmi]|uniref:Uncharacterized protein LOC117639357 isoform X2 n=1 Tax=Thrips palmi TaxID=161013 RepID=A0A6P8XV43_THRPL|nr:uncharacterized protein LOC117639357 isoform X2 [Thrips palmi]
MATNKAKESEGTSWDSDGSLSWEDFFGKPTELVPTLLGMYDALVGRSEDAVDADATAGLPVGSAAHHPRTPTTSPTSACPPPGGGSGPGGGGRLDLDEETVLGVPRPLSVTSIASSSSSSSGTSSCGRQLGVAPKSSAYLASIESLDDTDDEEGLGKSASNSSQGSAGSGSGDSGVCSPCSPCSHLAPPLLQQGQSYRHPHPHLSFMDRVVMEIIETEGVYVRDLQQIIMGYLTVWRCRPDCALGAAQLDALFGNIQDVYHFNAQFLRQLEQCDLDPVQVARCFVRNNAGFSVYTEYCTNYPRTVGVLTELMRREGTVRLFRERQAALQHTLPLGSYLLKPVQRILKYHLLLQNIVKHSSCDRQGRDGYGDIVDALSTMTAIAHHINDMKRRHEHAVRVQEIQSLLYGWEGEDLTTFGELCAEGTFRMAGAKALRHVFLFDKMLLITKKKEEAILGFKAHIMCSNLMLIESVPGEPLSFHVIPFDNPRMQYTLQARTLEQKREWSMQLKRVILENYHAVIPSHARQLVMELGQNRADDAALADKVTPRRQHSAPEYLERRKQERERRKSETGLRYRLRRNRKSDADTIAESATRRGRRGSSSSREGEREDSLLSLADRTRDRFASWRRKSEPVGYLGASNGVANANKRPITIDLQDRVEDVPTPTPSPPPAATSTTTATARLAEDDLDDDQVPTATQTPAASQGSRPASPLTASTPLSSPTSTPSSQPSETIEQIVSQLLMQNREFQRILKKQQRQISLRHRITAPSSKAGETTDDDAEDDDLGEEEEESIYETLSALATVHHSAHRRSHLVECSNDEDDYVTLVCRADPKDEDDDDDQSRPCSRLDNKQDDEDSPPPTAPPRPRARLKRVAAKDGALGAAPRGVAPLGVTRQDSLQSLWERLRRSQRLGGKATSFGSFGTSVRRAASFTSQQSQHSQHSQHSQQSNSHFYVDTPCAVSGGLSGGLSGGSCQPITPAVWLKQQGPHLETAMALASSHKAGSLPRSFQVGPEGEALPGRSKETLRACILRSGRSCPDRPFTIASDKPSRLPSRLSMEDMERFERHHGLHGQGGDTTEDDSMTEYTATPNASLHELNVHPEYKIYRPTLPGISLRHVLAKLAAGLRGGATPTPAGSETASIDWEGERVLQRERRRVAAVVVKQYSKTLRRRIRNLIGDEQDGASVAAATSATSVGTAAAGTASTTTTTYAQGSSGLGARIASLTAESDYANPRLLFQFQHVRPSKKVAALLGVRPDSVLSVASAASAASSSNLTASTSASSSDGDKTSGFGGSVDAAPHRPMGLTGLGLPVPAAPLAVPDALADAQDAAEPPATTSSSSAEDAAGSDCSADSFYERSFEAMESVLESTDVFRDSAVFTDHDDCSLEESDDSSAPPRYPPPPPPQQEQSSDSPSASLAGETATALAATPTSATNSVRQQPRSKVPPPVPSKPKKHLRPSLGTGDLASIPMTSLVSRLSEVALPSPVLPAASTPAAPLAVPDQDDQCDSGSQYSAASTVMEGASCPGACPGGACPSGPTSKGWVKHVIGRLQGEAHLAHS